MCCYDGAAERGNGSSLPCGIGEAVSHVSTRKLLQVVLVSPQVPRRSCQWTHVKRSYKYSIFEL